MKFLSYFILDYLSDIFIELSPLVTFFYWNVKRVLFYFTSIFFKPYSSYTSKKKLLLTLKKR